MSKFIRLENCTRETALILGCVPFLEIQAFMASSGKTLNASDFVHVTDQWRDAWVWPLRPELQLDAHLSKIRSELRGRNFP